MKESIKKTIINAFLVVPKNALSARKKFLEITTSVFGMNLDENASNCLSNLNWMFECFDFSLWCFLGRCGVFWWLFWSFESSGVLAVFFHCARRPELLEYMPKFCHQNREETITEMKSKVSKNFSKYPSDSKIHGFSSKFLDNNNA
jgi:hypothetical protein